MRPSHLLLNCQVIINLMPVGDQGSESRPAIRHRRVLCTWTGDDPH